ncbi:MAG: hydrogenase nickel incorporation protein HypB [Clostridiales bacterium]|nr:hydrogenase nickel incorporation protein HypB [Clostridiales bacterium]
MMRLDIKQDLMELNNAYALENRRVFGQKKVLSLNVMGSPGSGKTSLLENLLACLAGRLRAAVIEGDLATARDAERIAACGAPVVQINTNGGCHLDAKMIAQVLPGFDLDGLDLLIIENVGNLVCPAAFDLGEDMKLLVMSIAEGGDKPAKYPTAFLSASCVVVNKTDLLPYSDVDLDGLKKEMTGINPALAIFETCCRPGSASGIERLAEHIINLVENK